MDFEDSFFINGFLEGAHDGFFNMSTLSILPCNDTSLFCLLLLLIIFQSLLLLLVLVDEVSSRALLL
jgi:hypothetical protein